jgi:hypothetical protein
MDVPLRITQTRMRRFRRESIQGRNRQILSTKMELTEVLNERQAPRMPRFSAKPVEGIYRYLRHALVVFVGSAIAIAISNPLKCCTRDLNAVPCTGEGLF